MAEDSDSPQAPPGRDPPLRRRRKLSAIMMADVSGFSRMMGNDEESTVDLIQDFHRRVTALVEQFEGRVVDTAGDSVFGEFDSVVNATLCACRIQEEQAAANAGRSADRRVATRIGIHLGDVIVEDYRVYGDGVNIAARLEPLAEPGGICISEAVYDQIRSKLDVRFEELGVRELKNIEHPIRIYRTPSPSREKTPPENISGAAVRRSEPVPGVLPGASDVLSAAMLVPLIVAAFLLASPLLLFPTAGVFPTAGAILASVVAGRLWAQRSGRSRGFLLPLGLGIASGALWTDWSRVTNVMFLLAGAIISAVGAGARRH